MAIKRNAYLDAGSSGESDNDPGYDSEAAEQSKGGRTVLTSTSQSTVKRRRLSPSHYDKLGSSASETDGARRSSIKGERPDAERAANSKLKDNSLSERAESATSLPISETITASGQPTNNNPSTPPKKQKKPKRPGVIYLSSLPPYLRPTALRTLLTKLGFIPITRLFLTPASTKTRSKSNRSRQLYTEGWIEFASHSTAKKCAQTLNAQPIGGRKGGFYHDDMWNMRYLRGMGWEELMAGVRGERREAEARRDEERRVIARRTREFVERVEEGRRRAGMMEKRRRKKKGEGKGIGAQKMEEGDGEVRRTWRQFEVKGSHDEQPVHSGGARSLIAGPSKDEKISDDVKRVLGKIF